MTSGFETILSSFFQLARSLNIDVLDEFFVQKEIFARKGENLQGIEVVVLHRMSTILLFKLKSILRHQWKKFRKVHSNNGSLLFCPSFIIYAFTQSKGENCLNYLNKKAHEFNGGVPNFKAIDFSEQLWIVDRLEHLDTSKYFQLKIYKELMLDNWFHNCSVMVLVLQLAQKDLYARVKLIKAIILVFYPGGGITSVVSGFLKMGIATYAHARTTLELYLEDKVLFKGVTIDSILSPSIMQPMAQISSSIDGFWITMHEGRHVVILLEE